MTAPRILATAITVAGTVAFIAGWRVEHHTRKWCAVTWDALPCVCGYKVPNENDNDTQCLSCASVDLRAVLDAAEEQKDAINIDRSALNAALRQQLQKAAEQSRKQPTWAKRQMPAVRASIDAPTTGDDQ